MARFEDSRHRIVTKLTQREIIDLIEVQEKK